MVCGAAPDRSTAPRILGSYVDVAELQLPALVLERLPGVDLGAALPSLTTKELGEVAREVVRIQSLVAQLEPGKGFGYVESPTGPWPHASWRDAIEALVQRSVGWFGDRDCAELLGSLRQRLARHDDYFARVAPAAYLDDITTKNVIVDSGVVSGIVDVDWLAYGDALMTPALAKVSLIASGQSTEYVDVWCSQLHLSDEQLDVFDAYTALYCFVLLSESGMSFNKDAPTPVVGATESRLTEAFDNYVS